MTRQERLQAISTVYGAPANGPGTDDSVYGNVEIFTQPRRTIILSESFVERKLGTGGMSQDDFVNYLRLIPDQKWTTQSTGELTLCLS